MHTHYVSTVVHVLLQVFVLQEEVAPLDKDVHVQKVYKRIFFFFSVIQQIHSESYQVLKDECEALVSVNDVM